MSEASRGQGRLLVVAALVVAVALIALLVASPWSDSESDGEFVFVAAADPGADPFTEDVAEGVPLELAELSAALAQAADEAEAQVITRAADSPANAAADVSAARLDAVVATADEAGLAVIAPPSEQGVGLYGGSGVNACDSVGLIGFLEADQAKSRAFAEVQGIDVSDVGSFIDGLTPGFLLDDTNVVNHSFENGEAKPLNSTLEAGTAVLVDDLGVPRVRCKCGNPLDQSSVTVDGQAFDITQFADRVAEAVIDPRVRDADGGDADPASALGPPDSTGSGTNYLSLGVPDEDCGFRLDLEFVDNVLVDGPGTDLRIFEVGPAVEGSLVFVREDSTTDFLFVGEIGGSTSELDIGVELGSEAAATEFTQVRLCDNSGTTGGDSAGADIDAVAAINSRPR